MSDITVPQSAPISATISAPNEVVVPDIKSHIKAHTLAAEYYVLLKWLNLVCALLTYASCGAVVIVKYIGTSNESVNTWMSYGALIACGAGALHRFIEQVIANPSQSEASHQLSARILQVTDNSGNLAFSNTTRTTETSARFSFGTSPLQIPQYKTYELNILADVVPPPPKWALKKALIYCRGGASST